MTASPISIVFLQVFSVCVACARRKVNSFHYRCSRFITENHIRLDTEHNTWIYPSRVSTLAGANLLGLEEYIQKRKDTIMNYAEDITVYTACKFWEGLTRNDGSLMWWKQSF